MGPRRSRVRCLSLHRPHASQREPLLPRARGRSVSGPARPALLGPWALTCGACDARGPLGRASRRLSGPWQQCRSRAS
eukprot:14919446-Alexandrium_andersonii.AAC.1